MVISLFFVYNSHVDPSRLTVAGVARLPTPRMKKQDGRDEAHHPDTQP